MLSLSFLHRKNSLMAQKFLSVVPPSPKRMANIQQNRTDIVTEKLTLSHSAEEWYKILIVVILLVSTSLNSLVLIRSILMGKECQRNYMIKCFLMCNLAVSDLCQSTIGYTVQLISLSYGFVPTLCQASGFIIAFFAYVSITISITLNIESCIHICLPWFKEKIVSSRRTFQAFCFIFSWAYAFFWAVFPLIRWNDYSHFILGACTLNWDSQDQAQRNYIILLFTFCIIVPFILTVICSFQSNKVIRQMRCYAEDHFGAKSAEVAANVRAESSILRLTLLGASAYMIVWMPYSAFSLIRFFGIDVKTNWYRRMGMVATLLAKTSSISNPLIYAFSQASFRKDIKRLFKGCFSSVMNVFAKQRSQEGSTGMKDLSPK